MTTKKKTRAGALALALCCVAMAALLVAGPASAASRGYVLTNKSNKDLVLQGAHRLPTTVCTSGFCVPTEAPMAFEGRPDDHSTISRGENQRWELKYSFGHTYAALLKYKIAGTDAMVEYTIETSTYTNDSACKVTPPSAGHCSAGGLGLTFTNG
jgi:hypothetical protein